MRISRDTKFGYGFLLAGTGLPYLIDKLLGPLVAVIVSIGCLLIGIAFLVSGHFHREAASFAGWDAPTDTSDVRPLLSPKAMKIHNAVELFLSLCVLMSIGYFAWKIYQSEQREKAALSAPSTSTNPVFIGSCRGDRLAQCSDAELSEWGKPLAEKLANLTTKYSLDLGVMTKGDPIKMAKELTVLEQWEVEQYRDCCAQDVVKYLQEANMRLGGGMQNADLNEWSSDVLAPKNSARWRRAVARGPVMLLDADSKLNVVVINLESKAKLQKLEQPTNH